MPIHDYGEIDGILYVDMRMINGSDLRKVLKNYGPMTPARAVAIVRQVASALDAAHEAGVMHRDVKPENILINREDFAYLVDFGIANAAGDEKMTELGTAVGTYAYMSPERFTNGDVTYRADVYALACVLHECLTGAQPFTGDSVSVLITAHLMQPIPKPSVTRPGVPTGFDNVIARGMAKNPEDRYPTAGDLATAATEALTASEQDQADRIVQRGEAATSVADAIGFVRADRAGQHAAARPATTAAGVLTGDGHRLHHAAAVRQHHRRRPRTAPARSPTDAPPPPAHTAPARSRHTAHRRRPPRTAPARSRRMDRHHRPPGAPQFAGSQPRADLPRGLRRAGKDRLPVEAERRRRGFRSPRSAASSSSPWPRPGCTSG